ncbi:MAG: ureidoglycolate lyase [Pseudomonadota bacterium]
MNGRQITPIELQAERFAPFGDVLEIIGPCDFVFNGGMADRWHAQAFPSAHDGQVAISLARALPRQLPLGLEMVERHPMGSQAFMPLSNQPFLVIVSADQDGRPARPTVFLTNGRQGVNYRAGTWHGVLTPLGTIQDFLIVDRVGPSENLEEHFFEEPWEIVASD